MNTEAHEPSRLPVRGTIATFGTIGALTLLLSFQGGPLARSVSVTVADDESPATDPATDSTALAVVEPVTYTGDVVETRWGDVQVEVTLEGADIAEVVALELPEGDHHTSDISDYVEPILREEAITSDSADVSVISGATYTSEAYAASLQSALDQAGLATDAAVGEAMDAEAASETEVEAVEPEVVVEETAEEADSGTASDETRTASGDVVSIRWGEVQVAVTVEGDDIVDVKALAMPDGDHRTSDISDDVEPILREEAIASDSADVSVISGATYTSKAYATSLQSALDQLGI